MKAFISYAHADEKQLDRFHKHLAVLQREGSLVAWHDSDILAGDKLNGEIDAALAQSELFIALVSPDYLASNYCYEKEFASALELNAAGKLRIVPVILEPCDWLSSPLSQFLAIPKDGLPVSEWANQNNAFLDVVNRLRRVITSEGEALPVPAPALPLKSNPQPLRVRVQKDFDSIQKAEFADRSFEIISKYFVDSCKELDGIDENIKAKFNKISDTSFTCTVVNRAKIRGGEAAITIGRERGRHVAGGGIVWSNESFSDLSSSNGSVSVSADEYNLYLSAGPFGFGNDYGARSEERLSAELVADKLWRQFVERAGIKYE